MREAIETNPAFTVYMDAGMNKEEVDKIGQKIHENPAVSKIIFVSAEQAWTKYKEEYLEEYANNFDDENPFKKNPLDYSEGTYYEVYINDITAIEDLSEYFETIGGVNRIHVNSPPEKR